MIFTSEDLSYEKLYQAFSTITPLSDFILNVSWSPIKKCHWFTKRILCIIVLCWWQEEPCQSSSTRSKYAVILNLAWITFVTLLIIILKYKIFAAKHVYMTLKWKYYPKLSANIEVGWFYIVFNVFIKIVILLSLWNGIKWSEDSDLGT